MKYNSFNFIILLLLMFNIGCATYQMQDVTVKEVKTYKDKASSNGIEIAIDPYDDKEKLESAFYIDLSDKDIRTLHVIVENNSLNQLLIQRSDIKVINKGGIELNQVNSTEVFEMFDYSEFLHALAWGIFGALSAADANATMQKDWKEKEFPEENVINTKERDSGFIFFQTEENLLGGNCKIQILNVDTNENMDFEIPVL
ncbi:MAG: hypothetical protein ACR2NW_01125 [Thermodesulfobacteriota bacterium]